MWFFFQAWVCSFEKPQTSPNSLSPSTTVLSPYITFGCLSARTFWWRLTDVYQGVSGLVYGTVFCTRIDFGF